MSRSLLWMRGLVLSAIVLGIISALGASAKSSRGGGEQGARSDLKMATVDLKEIDDKYLAKKSLETDLENMKAKFQRGIERRQAMPLLSDEEQKALDVIYDKDVAARTDAEKKKLDDLNQRGTALSNEAQALRQKPEKDLTDADKKRMKEVDDSVIKAQQSIGAYQTEADNTLKQFVATKGAEVAKAFKEAVKKVSEKQGLAIVFNAEVAPYAGIDITPQVLAELNKK